MALSYPYYEVTGNGPGGGVSVDFAEPVPDGVAWTQANTDAIVAAIVNVVAAVPGITQVTATRYATTETNVTP